MPRGCSWDVQGPCASHELSRRRAGRAMWTATAHRTTLPWRPPVPAHRTVARGCLSYLDIARSPVTVTRPCRSHGHPRPSLRRFREKMVVTAIRTKVPLLPPSLRIARKNPDEHGPLRSTQDSRTIGRPCASYEASTKEPSIFAHPSLHITKEPWRAHHRISKNC